MFHTIVRMYVFYNNKERKGTIDINDYEYLYSDNACEDVLY